MDIFTASNVTVNVGCSNFKRAGFVGGTGVAPVCFDQSGFATI